MVVEEETGAGISAATTTPTIRRVSGVGQEEEEDMIQLTSPGTTITWGLLPGACGPITITRRVQRGVTAGVPLFDMTAGLTELS